MFVIRIAYLLIVCFVLILIFPTADNKNTKSPNWHVHPSIKKFREYLRIDTSVEKNIAQAVSFWKREADAAGLQFAVYKPAGLPVIVLTWPGQDPSLPSIMLNSHMDVVPADAADWSYPPFEARMDENGNIYGRGSQDTKDVSIQYLEAVNNLRKRNVTLSRTAHITLMPDEEIGGLRGMSSFIGTADFKALNIGFALDEGLASPNDDMFFTYVDKRPWQVIFHVNGASGHSLGMPENSAAERTIKLLELISKFREKQRVIMKSHQIMDYGKYTSVNINIIQGGEAVNVIAGHFEVTVDFRLAINTKPEEMMDLGIATLKTLRNNDINAWVTKVTNDKPEEITIDILRQMNVSAATLIDESNPYLMAMYDVAKKMDFKLIPVVCPATSDMVEVRNIGIPAFGFTPKTNTISKIHGVDEYHNAKTFLKGIQVYENLLLKLGNLPNIVGNL